MKCLIQRVLSASVSVDGACTGSIERGFLVFLGITHTDTEQTVEKAAEKIRKLRIFEDENGKTNLSIEDVHGELLVVSQFTLYADCRRGNRPGFEQAAAAAHAKKQKLRFSVLTKYWKKEKLFAKKIPKRSNTNSRKEPRTV